MSRINFNPENNCVCGHAEGDHYGPRHIGVTDGEPKILDSACKKDDCPCKEYVSKEKK